MKSQSYMNRALRSSDPRYARILGKLGYGTRDMVAERAEPVQPKPAVPAEDIADVRAEYERVVGRRAFNGWDIPTLRQKMAEAKDAD